MAGEARDATEAMVRQNELTEAAQRPWIQIEAEVTKAEFKDHKLTLQCEAIVKNVGKMVAESCAARIGIIVDDAKPSSAQKIEKIKALATHAASSPPGEGRSSYPLLPGERTKLTCKNETTGALKGIDYEYGEGQRFYYTVFVVACYHVPGDSRPHETHRGFCFTYFHSEAESTDPFSPFGSRPGG